jgi:serine/threonine-protein kinase
LVFGKYRLVESLGDTETGEAHLAKLIGVDGFEKYVVIWRVGRTRMRSADLVGAMMFQARQGAVLSHAGIAQVLDLGVVDGRCFVATEHVSGHTLESVLRVTAELAWPVAAHIGREVAGALSYAHGRRGCNGELLRLVHQRLCPGRIALNSAADVKVTGFGTTWALAQLDAYRSPEEERGEPVDGRADVFALGVILRACISDAGAPRALHNVIDHAMQSYPEHRLTAAELQQELTRVLHTAQHPVGPRDIAVLSEIAAVRS